MDFEYFRGWLVEGLGYGDGSKGGRPPFDPVAMFKILILQAQHNLFECPHGVHDPRPPELGTRKNPRSIDAIVIH